MFCKNCGREIDDKAVVCIHCGCSTQQATQQTTFKESKTVAGVLLSLFLGLIGLIIGLCLYPANTYERQTFLKGWGITFGICVGFVIVIYAIIFATLI